MPSGHLNKHSRNGLSHRCLTIIEEIHLFEALSGRYAQCCVLKTLVE